MQKLHRITSIIVLLCFLLNTTTYGLTPLQSRVNTFNLATASIINKLGGIEHKDIGRIKLALEANLIGVDLESNSIEDLTVPENTVFSPADMHFFFSEIKSIPEGRFAVMCRIKEGEERRTYYAVFSPEKDEDKGFPVEVYTEGEWEKLKDTVEFTGIIPERKVQKPKDAEAIERYMEHEKEIDWFLAEKIQQGNSFTCDDNTALSLLHDFDATLGILKLKNAKDIIKAIEKRKLVFIHANEDELPEIHILDLQDNPRKIKVFSHASNNAIYITLNDEEWEQFQKKQHEMESHGRDLKDNGIGGARVPLYGVTAMRFMTKFTRHLLHETGVICSLPSWAEDKNGKYVVCNVLDKLQELSHKARRVREGDGDLMAELIFFQEQLVNLEPIADLDTNLEIRDYAAGEFSDADIVEIAIQEKVSRDIELMVDFDEFFETLKKTMETSEIMYIASTYQRIKQTIDRISAEIEAKYKEEAIKTVKIDVIPGGEPGDTLVVTIKGKERIIGIYDSFLHGINRLVGLMSEDWHAQSQQYVLDALIKGAVLHEMGHGFEGYSGIDLHTLFTNKETRESIADNLVLEQEEGQSDMAFASVVAETLADMCIGGPGNADYVPNKAAYLFYRLFSFRPGDYVDENGSVQSDEIRDLVGEYYELNPHFELWSGGQNQAVATEVVRFFSSFFGPGTLWNDRTVKYREEATATSEDEEDEAKQEKKEEKEARIAELVEMSYAGKESIGDQKRRSNAREALARYGMDAIAAIDEKRKEFHSRSIELRRLNKTRGQVLSAMRHRGISAKQGSGERMPTGEDRDIERFFVRKAWKERSFTCPGHMISGLLDNRFSLGYKIMSFKLRFTNLIFDAIKQRQVVFVKAEESELPKRTFRGGEKGRPPKGKVSSYTTDEAIYIALDDKTWESFPHFEFALNRWGEYVETGKAYNSSMMDDDYKTIKDSVVMKRVTAAMLHEIGELCGLPSIVEEHEVRNDLDRILYRLSELDLRMDKAEVLKTQKLIEGLRDIIPVDFVASAALPAEAKASAKRAREQDEQIATFIMKKMQEEETFKCTSDMITAMLNIYERNLFYSVFKRFELKNSESILETIKQKELVFIHANKDELPKVQMRDSKGVQREVEISSFSSQNVIYTMLNDREWEVFNTFKDVFGRLGKAYKEGVWNVDLRIDSTKLVNSYDFQKIFARTLIHEVGILCGLQNWAEYRRGSYVPYNRMDKLSDMMLTREALISRFESTERADGSIEYYETLPDYLKSLKTEIAGIKPVDPGISARQGSSERLPTGNNTEVAKRIERFFTNKIREGESFTCTDDVVSGLSETGTYLNSRFQKLQVWPVKNRGSIFEAIISRKIILIHANREELPVAGLPYFKFGRKLDIEEVGISSHATRDTIYIALGDEEWEWFHDNRRADRRLYNQENVFSRAVAKGLIHAAGMIGGLKSYAKFSKDFSVFEIWNELDELDRLISYRKEDGNIDAYVRIKIAAERLRPKFQEISPVHLGHLGISRVLQQGRFRKPEVEEGKVVESMEEVGQFFAERTQKGYSVKCTGSIVSTLLSPSLGFGRRFAELGVRRQGGKPRIFKGKRIVFVNALENELPEIALSDTNGILCEVKVPSYTSKDTVYIALDDEEWDIFHALEDTMKRFGREYNAKDRARLTEGDSCIQEFFEKVDRCLLHEAGVICGLETRVEYDKEEGMVLSAHIYNDLELLHDLIFPSFWKKRWTHTDYPDKFNAQMMIDELKERLKNIHPVDILEAEHKVQQREKEKAEKEKAQKQVSEMQAFAQEVGIEVAPPVQNYTLFTSYDFYKDREEYESDSRTYGSRFNLERIRTDQPDRVVDNVLATMYRKQLDANSVIVQLPKEFADERYQSELQELIETGVRFMIIDVEGLKEDLKRAEYRRNIYSMMLLARKIDENTPKDSKLYRLLGFFIDSLLGDVENKAALIANYMEALVQNKDLSSLIKVILSYKPIERYEMPDYDKVSATLISA